MTSLPHIESALQTGAVLVAQYGTTTGFHLHLSFPMLDSIPHMQSADVSLEVAFAKLDADVRDDRMAEDEILTANKGRSVNPYLE